MNNWISVKTKKYPRDEENVQVTYLGYYDKLPRCNAFAFRRNGAWYWSMSENEVKVEITAWKKCCEPYYGR